MFINLIANEEEIKAQNDFYDNWKLEEPDDEYAQNLEYIKSLDDLLLPYEKFLVSCDDLQNCKMIEDFISDFTGIYISEYQCDAWLERMTTNTKVKEDKLHPKFIFRNFGVCDNASQAVDYLKSLELENIIDKNSKYVITLTPLFRTKQSPFGWRWKKWGKYIGVQNRKHEYLYDDKDIDLIFLFRIHIME